MRVLVRAMAAIVLGYSTLSAADNAGEIQRQIEQARRLEAMGYTDHALRIYREVYDADPENRRAASGIRGVLSRMEYYEELAVFLREERARHPEDTALSYALGEALYNAERREEATAEWNMVLRAISETPDGAEVLFQYGQQWEGRGLYEIAGTAYRTLIDRYEGSRHVPKAMLHLGGCRERMYRPEEALSTYEGLIRAFPRGKEAQEAQYRIGRVQLDVFRDVDAALGALRLASKVPGGKWRPSALIGIAACQVIRDKLGDADGTYATVSRERPGTGYDERASFERGRLAYYEGNFERAVQHLEAVAARFPDGLLVNDALSLLLMIEAHQGEQGEELRTYARAQLRRRQWRAGEAMAALDGLLAGAPSSGLSDDVLVLQGALRADVQDAQGALRTYEAVLSEYPASELGPQVRLDMARLYERLGQLTRAVEMYETFLVEYPEDVRAGETRADLREVEQKLEGKKALKEAG